MRSNCLLNFGVEIFGDKWTLLIIRDMMLFNKRYFNEFLASKEGISTNILTDRLNLLEKEKLITRKKDSAHKQKIIYSLTQKGIDLLPILIEIGLWSDKYEPDLNPPLSEALLGEVKQDKAQGLAKLKEKICANHLKN